MPCRSRSLFEIVKGPQESLRQFVDRFEATLKLISSPNQFTAYAAFIKRLLHDSAIRDHPILSNLVMVCTGR